MSGPIRPERPLSFEEWKRERERARAQSPTPPEDGGIGRTFGQLAGQAAEGYFAGAADKIAGGVGALVAKLSGNAGDLSMRELYERNRDFVRDDMEEYRAENPLMSGVARVAGTIASPLTRATAAAIGPRLLGASTAARAGLNAAASGATGFIEGAMDAPDGEAMRRGITSGLIAGAAGGALSPVADALPDVLRSARAIPGVQRATNAASRAAGRVASSPVGQRFGEAASAVREAITGPMPARPAGADDGAETFLRTLRRSGQSVDDFARWQATRDADDIAMEGLGAVGPRMGRTARLLGDEAQTTIPKVLDERARGAGARFASVLEQQTGGSAQSVPQFANATKEVAETVYAPLYQQTANVPLSPEASTAIARIVDGLDVDRVGVLKTAQRAQAGMPRAMFDEAGNAAPLTFSQALALRQAMDDIVVDDAATSAGRKAAARIVRDRALLDDVLKTQSGNPQAAEMLTAADDAFATMMRRIESFGEGNATRAIGSDGEAQRLLSTTPDGEAFRQGQASRLIERAGNVRDGMVGGNPQNPALEVMGDPARRRAARLGFPDDASYNEAERVAEAMGRQFNTRQVVTGGSQTDRGLVDVMDELMVSPRDVDNPRNALMQVAGQIYGKGRRAAVGQRMDEFSRYALAGAPGQMSTEQVADLMRRLEPFVAARMARQAATRSNVVGREVSGNLLPRERGRR